MPLTCQEEVFSLFRTMSGAKRIEMMCGLMNMCIPLEIRFFEAVIQDLSKKEYNSFRDAELKANSRQELEHICKCDLLAEKSSPEFEESEMNGNGGDGAQNNGSNDSGQKMLSKYPSRSKLIISLCLLQPTNHQCSLITYNSIREQLMVDNLMNTVYSVYIPKNYPIDGLFNETLLLLTMAMYHPAFSYEERDLLLKQKEDVENAINLFNNQIRLSAALQQGAIQQSPSAHQAPPAPGPPQANQPTYANPGSQNQHNLVHTPQHPPTASHQIHSYHPYGGQHQNAVAKAHLAAPHLHPQPPIPISFIQTFNQSHNVPIANMTYTPQAPQAGVPPQVPHLVSHSGHPRAPEAPPSQTNAVISNMVQLRISSPPSISSTSTSPTISPSSAKMAVQPSALPPNQPPIAIKLDNNLYQTASGLPPNSVITFVGDSTNANAVPGIPFMTLPPQHAVIVDDVQQKTSSSVSSNTSSASCFNCGSVGHRGSECTSGGDDNR